METGRGHLGGSVKPSEGKDRESAMTISRFSIWLPPPVSVKDQGVGTHEQVLNVPITCWWYVPSKPSSRPLIDAWLCPHCFIGWLGREAGYIPTDRSANALWIVSGALFLGSSGPAQLCWWLVKDYHIRGSPTGSVCRVYVDWHGKRTCRVGQVFPCRVCIDSNHYDSWIWVTDCSWLPSSSNLLD
jgi:uncharacterized membrane protein YqaE (UPF0057 family)